MPPPDLEAEPEAEAVTVGGETGPAEAEAKVAGDGPPKRKRTHRGSRGGRRRKAPQNGEPAEKSDEEAPEASEEPPVEEYVPMSEWIEDFGSRSRRAG